MEVPTGSLKTKQNRIPNPSCPWSDLIIQQRKVCLCLFPMTYQQRNHFDVTGLSVVKDEKLSVLLQLEDTSKTEIWVTNKIETTQVVSWSKVLAFHMRPGLQLFDQARFLLDDEKKVVMLAPSCLDFDDETKSRDMIYIVGEDNEATQVDFGPGIVDDEFRADILYYFPSLVQIERAGGKRKRADM
uniref:F-box protein n=1 Tax=Noccaea caerulescens TaxID=107243 RepID=A0A1J3GA24_NOCCA